MAEHEWVNVPEMSEEYVYTLPMPLEQHNAEMINAGREAIESELAAQNERFGAERLKRFEAEAEVRRLHATLKKMSAERDAGIKQEAQIERFGAERSKRFEAEAEVLRLHATLQKMSAERDAEIKQARARDADFELRNEKVVEQEQMIADLQAIIAENRGLNEQLDKQRREALNSASAARADARNGWSAFDSKSAEWDTLRKEQERRALDISHLREQLDTERRGHEATKATLTSERARWSQTETASELSHGLRAQIERQKETIIGLRKQVADALNARPEDVAKMAKERDAAVTLREGTRTALKLANEHCIRYEAMLATLKETVEALTLERNEAVENDKCAKERLEDAEARACELEKQIGPLKEDQEVVKRKYAASRDLLDRLQTDYYAEQAKVAQLCEQLSVAVRDHEATKSHHKSLISDTSDAANELGKVRRELEVEKGAAGELKKELEEAKAELARCQALANVNYEKWQWAKEDGQRVCQLAREHFIKLEAVEVENESLKRMLSEEGGEKHRLQLEREREEYEAAMKLPTTAERNAAVAKCFNSGVLPGASPEEVLASERMTASIVAAKAALIEAAFMANGLPW